MANGALYRPSRAFAPDASGALPFFHLALVTGVGAGLFGLSLKGDTTMHPGVPDNKAFDPFSLGFSLVYVVALGFLVWAVSRFAARLTPNLSSARAIAFGIFCGIVAAPMMGLAFADGSWSDHPLSALWIMRPLNATSNIWMNSMIATVPTALLGALFLRLDVRAGKRQAKAKP